MIRGPALELVPCKESRAQHTFRVRVGTHCLLVDGRKEGNLIPLHNPYMKYSLTPSQTRRRFAVNPKH